MPMVEGKKFPYTKAGIKAAKAYNKKHEKTEGKREREVEYGKIAKKPGLYANINAKKKRIASGSGERMRKPGSKGAPTAKAFRDSAR